MGREKRKKQNKTPRPLNRDQHYIAVYNQYIKAESNDTC